MTHESLRSRETSSPLFSSPSAFVANVGGLSPLMDERGRAPESAEKTGATRDPDGAKWAALTGSSSTASVGPECAGRRHDCGCRRNVGWRGRGKSAAETSSRPTIGGGKCTQEQTVSRCGRGPGVRSWERLIRICQSRNGRYRPPRTPPLLRTPALAAQVGRACISENRRPKPT
jgi:hypothetical protein